MKTYYKIACLGLLAFSFNTSAAIISHGTLVSDDTTNFITDTATGREYLRFDTFDLSYADTQVITSAGGLYEDWTIATSDISDDFINAILGGGGPCQGYVTVCGAVTGWVNGAFGASYLASYDLYAYESTFDTVGRVPVEIGITRIQASNGEVINYDDWSPVIQLDDFSVANNGAPINLLVYKNAIAPPISAVPVPAAVWLFGSGLLGIATVARRNKLLS